MKLQDLPDGWEKKPLWRIADISYGISEKINTRLTKKDGTRILTIANLTLDGNLNNAVERYFKASEDQISKNSVVVSDLLFNWRNGSKEHIGKTVLFNENVDKPTIHASFLLRIRCDKNQVLPLYLWAYLNFLRKTGFFKQKSENQINNKFNAKSLSELRLCVPPLPFQEKISKIIEKNMKIINRHTQRKQKLYKLIPAVFDKLFGNLEENTKQWKFDVLKNHVEDTEKWNPKKQLRNEFKYVEISSISREDKQIESYKIINKQPPSRARNVIRNGDVIFGTTRPYFRNAAIVPNELDGEICSTGFCVLRINDTSELNPVFLHSLLQTDFIINKLKGLMEKSHYPAINNDDLLQILIPFPDDKSQIEFQKIVIKHKSLISKLKKFDELMINLDSFIKYSCFGKYPIN